MLKPAFARLLIVLSLLTAVAHADPGGGGAAGGPAQPAEGSLARWFCYDPVNAICSAEDSGAGARAARVAAVRKDARERAKDIMIETVRLALGNDFAQRIRDVNVWDLPPPFSWVVLGFYNAALEPVVRQMVSAVQLEALFKHTGVIREQLELALDERLAAIPGAERTRRKMRARLREVKFLTVFEQEIMKRMGSPGYEQMAKDYRQICGDDGLEQNAFANVSEGVRYIVLCPGWTIAGAGSGTDSERDFRNLFHILAHEYGHHIDYSDFPRTYGKWKSCMKEHHARDLAAPGLDGHLDEMTADFWGVQAQVRWLRHSVLTVDEKVGFLRDAWGGFCSGGDDGSHPEGRFRIETLLRRDPDIAALMECGRPVSLFGRPGCTLQGDGIEGLF